MGDPRPRRGCHSEFGAQPHVVVHRLVGGSDERVLNKIAVIGSDHESVKDRVFLGNDHEDTLSLHPAAVRLANRGERPTVDSTQKTGWVQERAEAVPLEPRIARQLGRRAQRRRRDPGLPCSPALEGAH